jgi:hypothetical protein
MARMSLSSKATHALFHFREAPRRRLFDGKHHPMDLRGRNATSTAHNDLSPLFAPLEHGTRPDAKLLSHFYWN